MAVGTKMSRGQCQCQWSMKKLEMIEDWMVGTGKGRVEGSEDSIALKNIIVEFQWRLRFVIVKS